jgi:CDP-glucose 4,6-dehydratase
LKFDLWRGKRVFITGHTGFKGLWLAKWLDMLGARVTGYSLPPDEYSLYENVSFGGEFRSVMGDVRDAESLASAAMDAEPDVIFHLAAQAIVKTAFERPAETFAVNVAGAVNVLETLRRLPGCGALVVVTSDKVYENTETTRPYDEGDRLGGDEPYAASKAAVELAVSAYGNAYFRGGPGVATARASNVYGGGDLHWDRLIPYLIKVRLSGGEPEIRNPNSVRPWQYILDPLAGYMALAEKLSGDAAGFSGCWNFGPPEEELYTVGDICAMLTGDMPRGAGGAKNFREAGLLLLDSRKSRSRLGWKPAMALSPGLRESVSFYKGMSDGRGASTLMEEKISSYMKLTEDIK